MQLRAAQTSLEPQPHRVSRTGRRPFVSQNTQRRRQPNRGRARPAQRPRIPDPQTPSDDLNKLPNRRYLQGGEIGTVGRAEFSVLVPVRWHVWWS